MSGDRRVCFSEFGLYEYHGAAHADVTMSETSARILARRWWAWNVCHESFNAGIALTDDEMLAEFMLLHWAGFVPE